ncbi:MAG: hypothetical protein R6U36_08735 [Candidatus Fermentibacteraceae bacterium]
MASITERDFLSDSQGRRFRDVVENPEFEFRTLLDFFSDDSRQTRMEDSERHHDRPALAGVVRELENTEPFLSIFTGCSKEDSRRLRQAIGVVVRLVMEGRGWKKTGKKGSLGQMLPKALRQNQEVSHNTSGLSWWFRRVERYSRPDFKTYPQVCTELPESMKPKVQTSSKRG